MEFFSIIPGSTGIAEVSYSQGKLKTGFFPFFSIYGPGHLGQNKTIRGRPQDAVC